MAPQAPRGDQASADAKVQVALRILEDGLVAYRSGTSKGRAIMRALSALTREFGGDEDNAQRVMPAELKSALMDNQPAPPSAPPPAGGGGGGGLPPGQPPGMA
jgi:hypothetical protein